MNVLHFRCINNKNVTRNNSKSARENQITICICDHQARDLLACVDVAMILSNCKQLPKIHHQILSKILMPKMHILVIVLNSTKMNAK